MSAQESAGTVFNLLNEAAVEQDAIFRVDDGSACLDANALRLGIERRARMLTRVGVQPGDRVLLSAMNSVDWVVSLTIASTMDVTSLLHPWERTAR